jgi:hypothetical protein
MLPNLVPVQAPVPSSAPVRTPPAPVQTPPTKVQRTRVQAPVQEQVPAPVAVNTPPVVGAPLVAVVNAPEVVNAPVVVQHVAVVGQDQVETPMEVEDEDALLQRLFFKRFGRALPEEKEKEKEKENEVDQIKFVIDLTDDTDEMEVATPVEVAVVKTEPVEAPEIVANVADVAKQRRASRRLEIIELARARKAINEFGRSLRKKDVIPEKEAPITAGNVIADNDTDMAEDVSANPVESVTVNTESGNTSMTYEQTMAAIDAAIADN